MNFGVARERLASGLGEVAHRLHAVDQATMDPAQRLPRPERLLAALGEERRQRVMIEIEEVDHESKALRHGTRGTQGKDS